jgi:selenocysteine-specific elongation factor
MHIVGTAGHVDHGKSALVEALTGTHPDRWAEERERGMTLDLGFAHLRFDDGTEAGIVDVPGHERFLHNMLAGAAGMEILLLVVALDEGPMPQTYEHLQILAFLGVPRVIVVMTKCDLIPDADREAARSLVREALRGTIAEEAEEVVVSARTGEGIARLRERIHAALRALPPRAPDAPVYLPVDRVFALPGHGTILTGTLMQGRIATGDTLALAPLGERVRVRSVQCFGEPRASVEGGARVAVNVPGIETSRVHRGAVLVSPEFSSHDRYAVRVRFLESERTRVRRRMQVRVHIGTAEILGTLVLDALPSNGETTAGGLLLLRAPTAAFPGVRFILRRVSPKALLGGGEIVGAGTIAERPSTAADPARESVLAVLRARGLDAVDAARVAFEANLREERAAEILQELAERGAILRIERPVAYLDGAAAELLLERVVAALEHVHAMEPWALGMTSLALSRVTDLAEQLLVRILAAWVLTGRLKRTSGYYALPSHEPRFTPEQQALFARLLAGDPAQPLVPVAFDDVAGAVKRAGVQGALKAFDTLLAQGKVVKVGDALYRAEQIARIRSAVESFFASHETMTPAQLRDLLGTSRKYAVPLLEWMDAQGITIRSGDVRMLRERAKSRTMS